MVRIILGVIVGFVGWMLIWFIGEQALAAALPEAFGVHQAAFEEAVINGGSFTPDTLHLVLHISLASVVSLIAGFTAALIAGENKRAPMVLGVLLVAVGLLKAAMSWQYIPLWCHITFTCLLLAMTIIGGNLRKTNRH
ncbi:MAG: hypothetical protein IPK87_05125 [Planctomycetes bacterium]|nr:hypothetical protein [Planctomycetota bacterium]